MIELLFSDSAAGALKLAKLKHSIGGNASQKPINPIEGAAVDIAPLTLQLDIGRLSVSRNQTLTELFSPNPEAVKFITKQNEQTLKRLKDAKATREPVRVWLSPYAPGEFCGLLFTCRLLKNAPLPLSAVLLPQRVEEENRITEYSGSEQLEPERFRQFLPLEESLSNITRRSYASLWAELTEEDAPLRALVNGRMMSVPETFYDFALLQNIPGKEPFQIASILGKTLHRLPGVSDLWLYQRLQAMQTAGILTKVTKPKDGHPYSALWQKNA